MALGSARMFNIRLTQNFNAPYFAKSLADFWRRWHISFSSWILDYIFKPLQMQLRNWKNIGTATALVITFLVSGIWHGASWCFIIWGALHGLYLALSVFYKPYQKKIYRMLGLEKSRLQQIWQTLVTFNLVCFAWIFFRAATVSDALYVVTHLFDGVSGVRLMVSPHGTSDLIIAVSSILVIWLVSLVKVCFTFGRDFYQSPLWLRWGVYLCLTAGILVFNMDSNAGFIYFNF
jgi:D-alanyl-lipoteichoic acid acyltransferase DltB (MBOAT superfamily)